MVSQLFGGNHLFRIFVLINDNFDVLRDVLSGRGQGELAEADFTALRNTIFDLLSTRVDPEITKLWDSESCQRYIVSLGLQHYRHLFPRLVCQLFLLNDWNLNYSFSMKGKQFENTGLPLWMLHAARTTESQVPPVAPLQPSRHTIHYHQQQQQQQRQLSFDRGLFRSPTAPAVQRLTFPRSEVHFNTTHRRELRRPTKLARKERFSTSLAPRRQHKSLDQRTLYQRHAGLLFTQEPLKPTSQNLLATHKLTFGKQFPKKAITWPSEEADEFQSKKAYRPASRLGALDFLPRILKVTPDVLRQTFGHLVMAMYKQASEETAGLECSHCRAIISANLMMARERLMPSNLADFMCRAAVRRFTEMGYEEIQTATVVTVEVPELPREERLRNIAFQLRVIVNRADEQSLNREVSTDIRHQAQRPLRGNREGGDEMLQKENTTPTWTTEDITSPVISAADTLGLIRASPRTAINTPSIAARLESLPRM